MLLRVLRLGCTYGIVIRKDFGEYEGPMIQLSMSITSAVTTGRAYVHEFYDSFETCGVDCIMFFPYKARQAAAT